MLSDLANLKASKPGNKKTIAGGNMFKIKTRTNRIVQNSHFQTLYLTWLHNGNSTLLHSVIIITCLLDQMPSLSFIKSSRLVQQPPLMLGSMK